MSTQGTNLPADRMIRVEEILINVDDVMIAERFDETPRIYTEGVRYNKGLQITFRDGKYRRINTEMTVLEFEIERAKKFTPVTEEQPLVTVQPLMDEGWEDISFTTEWFYYRPLNEDWAKATDMGHAIEVSKVLASKHKAVIHRTQEKEFTPDDLY